MDIQIPLHITQPQIRHSPASECSGHYADPVPQLRQILRYHTACERHQAEAERGQRSPGQIIIVIQEDDRGIHQEQNEIPHNQTRIDPDCKPGETEPWQKYHTQQIQDGRDDELDSHQTHQLIGKLPEHLFFGKVDIRPFPADDRLRVILVFVMEMHLHPCDKDHRGGNISKHGKAGCHIIRLITDKGLHQHHPLFPCPEHEIMDIQPQDIEEIRDHQLPVFPKIPKHRFVAVAVLHKIPLHGGHLQDSRQEEARHQGEQHALPDSPVQDISKEEREQECRHHPRREEQCDLLIRLRDGQIDHGIEHQHQGNVTAVPGEHIEYIHLPHEMLPQAERDPHQAAKGNVHQKSHVIAGTDVLITFLKDHVRHIFGQHRVERSRRQQREDEYVEHRTGEQLPLHEAKLAELQEILHQNHIQDHHAHGRHRRYRTVSKSYHEG